MTTNSSDLDDKYKFYRNLFDQFGTEYGLPNLFDHIKNHFIVDDGYIGILNFDKEENKFGIRVTNCEEEGTGQIVEVYFLNHLYPGTILHVSEKIVFHAIHFGEEFTFDALRTLGYINENNINSILISPKTILYSFSQDIASLVNPSDEYIDYSEEEIKAKFNEEFKQQFSKILVDHVTIVGDKFEVKTFMKNCLKRIKSFFRKSK